MFHLLTKHCCHTPDLSSAPADEISHPVPAGICAAFPPPLHPRIASPQSPGLVPQARRTLLPCSMRCAQRHCSVLGLSAAHFPHFLSQSCCSALVPLKQMGRAWLVLPSVPGSSFPVRDDEFKYWNYTPSTGEDSD